MIRGNYDYRDMADITIENIPEVIEVLGNSDHIIVSPKVVSSLDGEVKEGMPISSSRIKLRKSGERWWPDRSGWI